MKKVLCTYGTIDYTKSLELLEQTAYEIGKVDKVHIYTRVWLETTDFYIKNKYILDQSRGGGFWLYKPYIILKTFESLETGDIVLYSDAGLKVIDNLNPLFDIARDNRNDGKMIFRVPWIGAKHIAKNWTKKDAFVLMGCDSQKYWDAPQTNGAVSLWEKNEYNDAFLREWLKYIRDPRIVTDDPNMCGPNFPEFKGHRHDQSALTILVTKYNYELYRDPTQWGNEEKSLFINSPYPQLFHHHRNFKH